MPPDDSANDITREATRHEEARLTRLFLRRSGHLAKTPSPQFVSAFQLGVPQAAHNRLGHMAWQLMLGQLGLDAGSTKARRFPMHDGVGKTLQAEEPVGGHLVEDRFKLLRRFGVRRKFASQLHPGMLAHGQQLQGAPLQGERGPAPPR